MDTNHGFILPTTLSPASEHDTNYSQYCTVFSRHMKQPIKKAFADKGYFGELTSEFSKIFSLISTFNIWY